MTANDQITIIETITGDMEVLSTRSDDAGVAYRAGLREVRKYRNQGYTGELIGVVEVVEPMEVSCEVEKLKGSTLTGPAVYMMRSEHVDRTYYRPVISPRIPEGE